jgi:hypothetical protein
LSSASIIRERAPALAEPRVEALALVWDEVAGSIVESMLAHEDGIQRELHINIKAEMALELAKLTLFFTDKVIAKRTADREIEQIDPEAERFACLGQEALTTIENTARIAYTTVWRKLMEERWLPKSRRAIERDAIPRPLAKLPVKPVRDKHFISRWFIRDYWTNGQRATCWRKADNAWSRSEIPFGRWGYRRELWGDKLEAYFALLEGNAKKPIQMLMATQPLNPSQQQAFVGHLIIHLLRNPHFISGLRKGITDVLEQTARESGVAVDDLARGAYETLFQNNELYDRYARPLLWSQWAIVASSEPIFVLPDIFCARGNVGGAHRLIVPLSPHKCFVTLAKKESEKRVVPFHLAANIHLARCMPKLLIQSAASEFLAHDRFSFKGNEAPVEFHKVLEEIELALGDKAQ